MVGQGAFFCVISEQTGRAAPGRNGVSCSGSRHGFSVALSCRNRNYSAKLQHFFLIIYIKRYKNSSKRHEKQKISSLYVVFSKKILIIKKNVIIL